MRVASISYLRDRAVEKPDSPIHHQVLSRNLRLRARSNLDAAKKMRLQLLSAAIICNRVIAINSTDDWASVDRTEIYRGLSECAKPCVRNVNREIDMGYLRCQSYGCVCSESTQGQNFLWGLSNVTECATVACSEEEDIVAAEVAYQDLCLVYAANSTRPTQSGEFLGRLFDPEVLTIINRHEGFVHNF